MSNSLFFRSNLELLKLSFSCLSKELFLRRRMLQNHLPSWNSQTRREWVVEAIFQVALQMGPFKQQVTTSLGYVLHWSVTSCSWSRGLKAFSRSGRTSCRIWSHGTKVMFHWIGYLSFQFTISSGFLQCLCRLSNSSQFLSVWKCCEGS